ncbi:hypothetical protein ACQ4M4_18830 [Leptolyngbya sp. AN02str]|uniref:hypothetical protein n=1 Tax=Leptolyngbya sp. AN02str TaxID=3423363 RepID=UPI003D31B231
MRIQPRHSRSRAVSMVHPTSLASHHFQPPDLPIRRRSRRAKAGWVQQWLNPPAQFWPAVAEAIAWMICCFVLRLGADWLLAIAPTLWIPVALGLVSPAILAIGLSAWVPKLSLVLGYRLLLTAMGLFLGGKL